MEWIFLFSAVAGYTLRYIYRNQYDLFLLSLAIVPIILIVAVFTIGIVAAVIVLAIGAWAPELLRGIWNFLEDHLPRFGRYIGRNILAPLILAGVVIWLFVSEPDLFVTVLTMGIMLYVLRIMVRSIIPSFGGGNSRRRRR